MKPTLAQNLGAASELLLGFVIVMATLTLLWALTALMARVLAQLERRAAAARLAPPGATAHTFIAPPTGVRDDALGSDEELAAVAAAVALLLAAPHRIVRVRPQPSAWGEEGRRDTHTSHRRR